MPTPNFTQVVRDIRAEQFDQRYDQLVADMVAADARREQANLLVRRNFVQEQRKYSAEPVAITDFGAFYGARVVALLAAEDEPLLTPEERAAEDYQHFRELQDKEARHGLD